MRILQNGLSQHDVTDKYYNRKYESLNRRLEKVFETLEESERNLSDCEARLQSIRQQCLSMDSIYESLKIFDKLYEKMSDYEKKNFVRTFIERIELYEDKTRHNGNPIKAVHFKFPVAYNGETVYEIVPPNGCGLCFL